jgi:hypothetical protein
LKSANLILAPILALGAGVANAGYTFSVHPEPVFPGQPAFVRIDETDGCFEYGGYFVKRTGSTVRLDVISSDQIFTPCMAHDTTPVFLPLGTFDAGRYNLEVYVCGNFPVNPCGSPTLLSLDVGGPLRRATIPAIGWPAMVLSCLGVLALALAGWRRARPTRP